MSSRNLFQPVTDQGVLNTNFFEGRLLTGRDLRDQLSAHHEHDRYLGKAIGTGIIEGLEVELDEARDGSNGEPPVVIVRKGLAINRDGDVIGLPLGDIQLSLSRTLEVPQFEDATFRNCAGIPYGQYVPNGVAIYILVMSPAAQYKEKALKSGLGDQGIAKGCGSRYIQEGVEFRLVELPIATLESVSSTIKDHLNSDLLSLNNYARKDEIARLSLLRNYLATICIGEKHVLADNLSDDNAGRDKIRVLYDPVFTELVELGDLKTSDVPLSLFYWTPQGITFNDMWSARRLISQLFPAGILRLSQFADHLEWLLDKLGNATIDNIDRYFRFIPPAALVPHRIINSARGFRPQDFLADRHRGVTDRTGAGQINRFLLESLRYPSIDLDSPAYLQVFTQNDLDNLPTTATRQQYFFYATRNLFGAHVNDEIAQVVADTWDVYRGLVRRQVFLPPATDAEKVTARLTIDNAIQDVLSIANRYAAAAATDGLDTEGALRVFDDLFDVQSDMVDVFLGAIPGIDDTQERELFAETIQHILQVNTPPGVRPSYSAALQNRALYQALDSQIEINRFVGQWSGEGVAVGPFGFSYASSPEGTALVPGADATPHLFTLTNGTNRTLEFQLKAAISSASGNWDDSITILRTINGNEIDRITLASGTNATIALMIAAPLEAIYGEPVDFQLSAEVGPPTNRTNTYTNNTLFTISEEPGEPVTGTVTITTYEFSGNGSDNLDDLPPGAVLTLRTFFTFEASGVSQADFAVDVLIDSASHDDWQLYELNQSVPLVEDPENVYSVPVDNATGGGAQNSAGLRILAPSGDVDSVLEFRLRVRSVDLPEELVTTHPDSITLRVRQGT
ncbi:MAG TPA: hypothetical protein VF268_07730 [Gammaproteobacteria bacterium]